MSIFSKVESGTSWQRSRFTKSISYNIKYDCQFGQAVVVCRKFCLPGDVWKIGGDVLVRFQPMLTPTLTPNNFKVRYFFVPLRLIESNSELVITGSKDGHMYESTLPVMPNFVTNADKTANVNAYKVQKHKFFDYLGVQVGDYELCKTQKFLPAEYWSKAYYRIKWDFYDDENIGTLHKTYADFETAWNTLKKNGANIDTWFVSLRKDYFTSSLPWQLKAVSAPTIQVQGTGTSLSFSWNPNYNLTYEDLVRTSANPGNEGLADFKGSYYYNNILQHGFPFVTSDNDNSHKAQFANNINYALNKTQSVSSGSVTIDSIGFSADDLRTMMAQTRIFERLARTGSRYVEYLRANFGTAPADETLQRAQYLGGWSVPIVTTEVLQTAAAGDNPVGTMRGHGITRGGNKIGTFHCKEFGVLIGIAHIIPNVEYTTGSPRELSYKERFDFFNPSFQHLSEQEVKKGELFVTFTSDDYDENEETFGYQAYANELRTSQNLTVGDMRDSLGYWSQSLKFTSRPELNAAFIESENHRAAFNAPFAVRDDEHPESVWPIIVEFANYFDVYRPMVRYGTPGLVDHL